MRGNITKRGDRTWLVRVSLGRDADGKRKYHSTTVHGTKRKADAHLTAVLRRIDKGEFVEPSTMKLGEYLDEWLKSSAKPNVRARTYEDYSSVCRTYLKPELGSVRLQALDPSHIEAALARMKDRGLSVTTRRHAATILSMALKKAVRKRYLVANPCDLADKPKRKRREMRVLSQEQVAKFLEGAKGNRMEAMFRLSLVSGMRPGEVCGLKWADLDFEQGSVTVQRSLTGRAGEWQLEETKTEAGNRTIPLPPTILKDLRAHRRRQLEAKLAAGQKWQNKDLIFCTEAGGLVDLDNVRRRFFKPIIKKAKLPKQLRWYDLRHTSATLLMQAGTNPKVVAERLGHTDVALTLQVYSHVLPSMQQEAASRLEEMVFQGSE